jgi:hypothetical protein
MPPCDNGLATRMSWPAYLFPFVASFVRHLASNLILEEGDDLPCNA